MKVLKQHSFRFVLFLEGSCDLSGGDRFECGWLGIDEATCLRRGCCWNSSEPDTAFCFVKKYQGK